MDRPHSKDPPERLLARLAFLVRQEARLAHELAATRLAVDWIVEDLEVGDAGQPPGGIGAGAPSQG